MGSEFCVEELEFFLNFLKSHEAVVVNIELVEEFVDFGVGERGKGFEGGVDGS